MGCRGCDENANLRRALRIAEAAADGALGVLADVQNALTERAIDPTPFGSKEEETLSGIAQLIKKYVTDVSRETEEEHAEVQTRSGLDVLERAIPEAGGAEGQDSGEGHPEVHRTRADGLGVGFQPDRRQSGGYRLHVPNGAVESGKHRRIR